jgi:hypothetical protein
MAIIGVENVLIRCSLLNLNPGHLVGAQDMQCFSRRSGRSNSE